MYPPPIQVFNERGYFRPDQALSDWLDARCYGDKKLTRTVKHWLNRTRRLLDQERASLHFTDEQLALLWEGLKDQDFIDPNNLDNIHDRWLSHLGFLKPEDRHYVAIGQLYFALKRLTPGQRLALADAIELARTIIAGPADRLRKAGL